MQILQTSGPIFRSSEDFLYVIKTYLCVSLSRNGVSSIPELFEMALFNFVELLDKFKADPERIKIVTLIMRKN